VTQADSDRAVNVAMMALRIFSLLCISYMLHEAIAEVVELIVGQRHLHYLTILIECKQIRTRISLIILNFFQEYRCVLGVDGEDSLHMVNLLRSC
jgi:hypothetical protein